MTGFFLNYATSGARVEPIFRINFQPENSLETIYHNGNWLEIEQMRKGQGLEGEKRHRYEGVHLCRCETGHYKRSRL